MLSLHRLWMLRQLDAHGGVVAAASALGYTPSALSQQIRALEREVGVPLVEKHGRGVRLSPAARAALPDIDAALTAVRRAEAELASQRAVVAGTVRLGAFPSFARAHLPRVLPGLRAQHPDLVVHVEQDEPEAGLRALEAGARDVVVAYDYDLVAPAPGAERAERCDLFAEPILLVRATGAADASGTARAAATGAVDPGGPAADLRPLAEAPWILPPPGTSCHDMVVRACGRAGFVPRAAGHCGDFGVVCALAAAGHGVGLVPALGVAAAGGLLATPTAPPLTRRVFAAVQPGSPGHPHVDAVLGALRNPP